MARNYNRSKYEAYETGGVDTDRYSRLVWMSPEDLDKQHIAATVRERVMRLRKLYAWWLAYPSKTERDVVNKCIEDYGLTRVRANEDVNLIKVIMGTIHKVTKDYARWEFDKMIFAAFEKARTLGDARAMAQAAAAYGKYHQLDKEDRQEDDFDAISPQVFIPTEDPRSLGVKKIPNIHERIEKLINKYRDANMELVKAEREDADIDAMIERETARNFEEMEPEDD